MNILTPEARAQIAEFYAKHKEGWILLDSNGNFRTKEDPHPLSDLEVLMSALKDTDKVNYTNCNLDLAFGMIFCPAVQE